MAVKHQAEYLVFLASAFKRDNLIIRSLVRDACARAEQSLGIPVKLWEPPLVSRFVMEELFDGLRHADVVVADVTDSNANVMLELGVRMGLERPLILVAEESLNRAFDLVAQYQLVYDLSSARSFVPQLASKIEELLRHPDQWQPPWKTTPKSARASTVFVSYSHVDADYLVRLRVHLKPLERAGVIELWDDTRIKSGQKWKIVIEEALSRAAVALLLISADFLASDFIVDNELPPLLRAAEERGTVVLPVILKPSRFIRDPNLGAFQAINDPTRPLISLSTAEQEAIYAVLAERIEAMLNPGA
jgi:nucleoside 2-deoxyribosyltransferase